LRQRQVQQQQQQRNDQQDPQRQGLAAIHRRLSPADGVLQWTGLPQPGSAGLTDTTGIV
jgi:hypothetical protein